MCGAGYSGRDCSVRYFSPGGLATPEGASMEIREILGEQDDF